MSYIKTKLSLNDKKILKKIYEELEDIYIPTSYRIYGKGDIHSRRTGTTKQKDARQTTFGKVYYQGKLKKSKSSKKYPYIMPLFKKFINSHYPQLLPKLQGVYVNKNTESKKHLDSRNTGTSLLVGFGPYTHGRSVLYIKGKPIKFHIKTNSLIFNGSEIPHGSEPFNGTRYSLVFFKRKLWR